MRDGPVRVCLVAPLPPPYGGIAHWTSMVSGYAMHRKDAALVVVNTAPTWRNIHSNGLLLRAVGGGVQLLRDIARLFKALRAESFDVVHLTTSGHLASVRDLVVSYIASLFGVALIYHIRFGRIPAIARSGGLEWRLIKKVMERATFVITIDQATLQAVQQFAPGVNVCLIPNCVNIAELPQPGQGEGDKKTALFLGWVVPTKGVGELVEAWQKTRPAGWKLDIIGPVDEEYKASLVGSQSDDRVEFLGQLPHKESMERMAQCDLFVLPSYTEGFPNVVVEAMALGRPIIATTVGAIPEMLEDGAGILIESKNTGVLAEAISRATSDADLRQRLGVQARKKAMGNYTIDVVFETYVSLWKRSTAIVLNRK